MRRLRILKFVLKKTYADKIILGFVAFLLIAAFIIWIVEPNICSYSDALWYCYTVISTIGFGDITVSTFIAKLCSVALTVYSLFVIAITTGVVVSFYTSCINLKYKHSKEAILAELEDLPNLSKEELEKIAQKIKKL